MSKSDSQFYIQAKVHVKGNTHDGGYCSDPYDMREIDTTTDEEFEITDKKFIKDFCDSDGYVDYDGLSKLSSEKQLCSGSGYCGTKVRHTVTRAFVKKRNTGIKSECLDEMSSDEEKIVYAPMPIVNTFRGRINTTYTATPNWYTTQP